MVGIIQAAKYLVYLSYEIKIATLTPLKLQKILYLAQGWSYVWDGKPLFRATFSAWQYGPVNEAVYRHFKKYGRAEIPEIEGVDRLSDINAEETLKAVWRIYAMYNSASLVELTHQQKPWKDAYIHGRETINNEDIKNYFQSTY